MTALARKILSKDPAAADKLRQEDEEDAKLGGRYGGGSKKDNSKVAIGMHKTRIPTASGPPRLTSNSERLLG